MSQYSGKVVFFEGKCFTGRKLEVFGDCENFQDRGFMNRVNSIRVESGAFVCFDHPDFKGQQFILEHGEYPEFQRWNALNDHMGSCRPIRMVRTPLGPAHRPTHRQTDRQTDKTDQQTDRPKRTSMTDEISNGSIDMFRLRHGEHYRVELFEEANFAGQFVELCEDCPFLQGRGLVKNCVNSIKAYGDGAWVLYEEPNYRGRMYVVERGDYCTHMEWQAQNPNIKSIRRVANYF
ncbi:Gamma-crystallin N-A [Merluccius polli]|uniref:Gamma-crystallin N-A n=1 Tax=Merluccius polli TaxID=89951 RepID=A0AA47NBF4_MERPO|nr:Gamma-crystallin N-A [Merluccius polli]